MLLIADSVESRAARALARDYAARGDANAAIFWRTHAASSDLWAAYARHPRYADAANRLSLKAQLAGRMPIPR